MSQIVRELLERIEQLPDEERAELNAEMARRSPPPRQPAVPRGVPAAELVALTAGSSPPPDDETIRRWIDEHRMEKYG